MYLYVAFKNPGYVTSYVMRGEEDYSEDIESMRNNMENHTNTDNINKR